MQQRPSSKSEPKIPFMGQLRYFSQPAQNTSGFGPDSMYLLGIVEQGSLYSSPRPPLDHRRPLFATPIKRISGPDLSWQLRYIPAITLDHGLGGFLIKNLICDCSELIEPLRKVSTNLIINRIFEIRINWRLYSATAILQNDQHWRRIAQNTPGKGADPSPARSGATPRT